MDTMARHAFALLLLYVAETESISRQCLSALSKHIESDNSLYYASISHDNDYNSSVINEINKAIISRLPGKYYESSAVEKLKFDKLRPNNLIVTISSNSSYVKFLLNQLHKKSWSIYRQHYLIISNNMNPKEILSYAWTMGFIDVTFLRPANSTIYQLNPFNDEINKLECNLQTVWFPSRMTNLHGHKVRVDVLHDSPSCIVKRNTSGHIISRAGAENHLFDLIARKLNVQPEFIPRVGQQSYMGYRNSNFLREVETHELLANIHAGKVQMAVNSRICPYELVTDLNYTCTDNEVFSSPMCPVVPIIRKKKPIDRNFIVAAGCLICLTFLIFIIAKIFRFDRRCWNFLAIIRLILGLTEQSQPTKTAETIIYACLIIASTTYLARFFDELTKFHLNDLEEVELETIDDIYRNNLSVQADYETTPKYKRLMATDESGKKHNISIDQWESRLACVKAMLQHKNITCLMIEIIGHLTVSANQKYGDQANMKVLDDCPWYGRSRIIIARGSPYVRPINAILPRLQAGGISNWLIKQDLYELKLKGNMSVRGEISSMDSDKIDLLLWVKFGFAGLFVASIVFLLESCVARYLLKVLPACIKN